MKGPLLKVFSAVAVIGLAVSVTFMDSGAQKMYASDAKVKAEKLQGEKNTAIEADTPKKVDEEQNPTRGKNLEEELAQKGTYLLTPIGNGKSLFTNKVDGYTIEVPADMKVDMSFSGVRAVLENDNLKLEIYRQETGGSADGSVTKYIGYSNRFIENNIDHTKESEGSAVMGGRTVYWLQWSRRALERVENDRCHYASVDVPLSNHEVITFLFKSSQGLENETYLGVAGSLKLIDKTAKPYLQKSHKTENKNWDKDTAAVFERYFGDRSGLHWGIYEASAPLDFTELKKIEARLDFTFPILLYYTGVLEYKDMHPGLKSALENAKKEGRVLELTLQTTEQTPGKGNMVYDVLDGKYDTYLKNYAKAVAASKAPVLFRLGNEMNGDWCVYSAYHTSKDTDVFKDFYRYIYGIFEAAGADNVIWIWNPNGRSFPDYKWNDELCYYPGDEYVDVIGMTSYNTGTYYKGEVWTEFDSMYAPLYEKYAARYEKPLMITEFSSSSVGGNKEDWVANMFRNIGKYDRIKVAVWWDGCDWDAQGHIARSYFIDETDRLVQIFRENLARYKESGSAGVTQH